MADHDPRTAVLLDLAPAAEFAAALGALEEAWAKVPAGQRSRLTRLVWLHPNGEMVVYQAPDGAKVPEEGDGG